MITSEEDLVSMLLLTLGLIDSPRDRLSTVSNNLLLLLLPIPPRSWNLQGVSALQ